MNPNQKPNIEDSDSEADPFLVNSRCRVIKVLQEQLENQKTNNDDYNSIKSQLVIAEQTLQMKEAEYKLRIDDLEYEIQILRSENKSFKSSLLSQKSQLPMDFQYDESEIVKKYKKWKTKYHSIINTDPSVQSAAKVFRLETDMKDKEQILQKKYEEVSNISEENTKLSNKIIQLNEELKRTKAALENSKANNVSLQTQINNILSEKQKLAEDFKNKATLLQHNRKVQARGEKAIKEKEETTLSQLKSQRRANLVQQTEITHLNTVIDKEIKEKKTILRKYNNMKAKQDEVVKTLNDQIETLKAENETIKQELSESKASSDSQEGEITFLKKENNEIQSKIKRAVKIKEANIRLAQTVNEMKETIEHLQSSISSFESDSAAKTEQMRAILSKNYAGIDPSMDWNDIVSYYEDLIIKLKSMTDENANLSRQLKKTTKSHTILKASSEEKTQEIMKTNETMKKQLEECQSQLKELLTEKTDDTALFLQTIRKKLDREFFLYNNVVHSMMAKLNNSEFYPVSMRSLVLMSVLVTRLRHYKKTDAYDGSNIIEFSSSKERNARSPVLVFQDKFNELYDNFNTASDNNEKLKKANADIQNKAKAYISQIKELQEKIENQTNQITEITNKHNELKRTKDDAATAADYERLEVKYNKKIEEFNVIEKQLLDMKVEMRRLLSTVDNRQKDDTNLQSTIDDLAIELEQLKQLNTKLKLELDIAQVSLKEKNREILALERRLIKQQTQVVVVKDQIPTGTVPQMPQEITEKTKCNFYMTDNLRSSLAQMQNQLMRRNEMI